MARQEKGIETQQEPVKSVAQTTAPEAQSESKSVEEKPALQPKKLVPPRNAQLARERTGLSPASFQMEIDPLRNTIHLIAQSKGGTGKTFVSSVLASFFQRHVEGLDMYCFDLDSNTKSFSVFDTFGVEQFSEAKLDENGFVVIDPVAFDGAFNAILGNIENDSVVVIDTGAGGSFWSLIQYLQNLDYPTLAASCDKQWRFIIHIVISGSAVEESIDTIERLLKLIDSPFVEFVVWGNEYFGSLKGVYDRIVGNFGEVFNRSVNLPAITFSSLDNALRLMRQEGLSVTELFQRPGISIIDKARINQYFYGNMAGKPGVFRALQNMDWSPRGAAYGDEQN